jgi:catechol 2,3-dioxygenase-like lactoylglutathione lyase family enzyme
MDDGRVVRSRQPQNRRHVKRRVRKTKRVELQPLPRQIGGRFSPAANIHMKFEHFALNVPEPRAQAQWYVQHVGFRIVRSREDAPFTHFLGDETGRTIVELYANPKATIPNHAAAHPLSFHLAVVAPDARAERARLERAGATLFLEEPQPDGSLLIMMRDPWGVPLQLCQRTQPFPMP